MAKVKVDTDKTYQEQKVRCKELEVSQHLSEAARRAIIEEYMLSLYFKSIRQEMARKVAIVIQEDLRSRHPSLDLSFMSLKYGIGPEPLASVAPGGPKLLPPTSHPQSRGEPSSPSFEVFRGCAPFEKL